MKLSCTESHRQAIEATAQQILDARALYPGKSLAWLYDPMTMPSELVAAHKANDNAVDAAYGYKGDGTEAHRIKFLFKLYDQMTGVGR